MVNYLWDNLFRKQELKSDITHILKDNFLFQDLNSRELIFAKQLIHSRSFKPGETIFRQGEVGTGMYIIAFGNVDIFVEDLSSEQPGDTHPHLITRLLEGDFMGELSLIEPSDRRSATAGVGTEALLSGFFNPD
ncbi:MAG: cyclic nucleotide-binding domain-containing protein, partial [Bdellovibrionales bacterium]|nr:cyclic nucleotide-binding domain-containing protein [Bdellovibrionales bacterium]